MTRKELKNMIREHKKEIAIIAGTTIAAGVLGYLGVKCGTSLVNESGKNVVNKRGKIIVNKSGKIIEATTGSNDIDLKLDTATVTETWEALGCANFILNDFKPADIGRLGKELVEKVPEINEDTILTCMLGTTKCM